MKHELYDIFVLKVNLRRTFFTPRSAVRGCTRFSWKSGASVASWSLRLVFQPLFGLDLGDSSLRGAPVLCCYSKVFNIHLELSSLVIVLYIPESFCFSCLFPLLRVGSLMRQRVVFTCVAYRTDRVSSPVSLLYWYNHWFVSKALSRFLQVRILISKYSRHCKEAKDSRWSEQWAFSFLQCEVEQMAQT